MTTVEATFAYTLIIRFMRLYAKSKNEPKVEVQLPEGAKFLLTYVAMYWWLVFVEYLF
jgi:hypothetical protein